jgi:hypothetical protein
MDGMIDDGNKVRSRGEAEFMKLGQYHLKITIGDRRCFA